MKNPYMVLDLETSVKNKGDGAIGSFPGTPWHPDNRIVALGYKLNDGPIITQYMDEVCTVLPDHNAVLVGHNIKFDMHYLRRHLPEWEIWLRNGKIWDTSVAEYILSGQSKTYPGLDYCAPRYGGTLKPDIIKEYLKEGYDTEAIPKEQLIEYLEGDVRNTELVYLGQLKRAKQLDMTQIILLQMDAVLATWEMEYNGMCFDLDYAKQEINRLEGIRKDLEENLKGTISYFLSNTSPNPLSGQHISLVLFGGSYKYEDREEVLNEDGTPYLYKSGLKKGQVKTKKVERTAHTEGFGILPKKGWESATEGIYQTNDDVLQELKGMRIEARAKQFISGVLQMRELTKDLSTYFQGYSDLVWHDGCIHQSLEHTSTRTGRLSCRNPNAQNLTN